MKKLYKNKILNNIDLISIFIILSIIGILIFAIANFIYYGDIKDLNLSPFFDHVDDLRVSKNLDNFPGVYPLTPIAFIIHYIISRCDGTINTVKTYSYFNDNIDGKIVLNMHSAYIYSILMFIIILFLIFLIVYLFKNYNIKNYFLSFAIAMSYPMILAYRNGNLIILSLVLVFYGIVLSDNKNKYIRYIGLLLIAISSAIKLYPAFFGLYILKNKRYKDVLILLLMGILVNIAPFFIFNGISSMFDFLNILSKFDNRLTLTSSVEGYISLFIDKIFRLDLSNNYFAHNVIRASLIIFSTIFCFISKKRWQTLFFIGFICNVAFKYISPYNAVFYIPGFIYLLLEENDNIYNIFKRKDYFLFIIFILYIMIFIWFLSRQNRYHLIPQILVFTLLIFNIVKSLKTDCRLAKKMI